MLLYIQIKRKASAKYAEVKAESGNRQILVAEFSFSFTLPYRFDNIVHVVFGISDGIRPFLRF